MVEVDTTEKATPYCSNYSSTYVLYWIICLRMVSLSSNNITTDGRPLHAGLMWAHPSSNNAPQSWQWRTGRGEESFIHFQHKFTIHFAFIQTVHSQGRGGGGRKLGFLLQSISCTHCMADYKNSPYTVCLECINNVTLDQKWMQFIPKWFTFVRCKKTSTSHQQTLSQAQGRQ